MILLSHHNSRVARCPHDEEIVNYQSQDHQWHDVWVGVVLKEGYEVQKNKKQKVYTYMVLVLIDDEIAFARIESAVFDTSVMARGQDALVEYKNGGLVHEQLRTT